MSIVDQELLQQHTEEIQDIISIPPNWLLRWGIILFFSILLLIIVLSAFIRYPDIVKTTLRIDSPNSPKPVTSKTSGKLIKLLVNENEQVVTGQALAYLESTANHKNVLALLDNLKVLQKDIRENNEIKNTIFSQSNIAELGELQTAYQTFSQQYLSYKSAINKGFFLKKKSYLERDLTSLTETQQQLNTEKQIQERNFELANDEYEMHKKLVNAKVETQAELRQEESKYLSKKNSLIQINSLLISGSTNYSDKQKEILEIDNQIAETKFQFLQALNSLISQFENWKSLYVLSASQNGKLAYAGIIQENQALLINQEVFYINPGNENFFGEMTIPQTSMGKVKEGQKVYIKLKSYPYEEYGVLIGVINTINEVPYRDSVFISHVNIKSTKLSGEKEAKLKTGMKADAEIITEDASLLSRITRNIIKMFR
jgi:multidrug efflux pump subunit AcrA (membrane-fusion protein)